MTVELVQHLARLGVPDACRTVVPRADDAVTPFVEREAADEVRVPDERAEALARVGIPELDRPVVAARDEQLATRRPRDAREAPRVAGKGPQGLARVQVPHLHERIARCGQDAVAVYLHGIDRTPVSLQNAVQLARRAFPHVRLRVLYSTHGFSAVLDTRALEGVSYL